MASISNPVSFFTLFPLESKYKSKRQISKVSCNGGDINSKGNNRRDVLIGLGGGLGAAASFTYNPFAAVANPVYTDPNECGPPTLPDGVKTFRCCPPQYKEIKNFEFPSKKEHIRVRKPAHLITGDDLHNYKRALQAMRDLHPDDPHSFMQQANIHCAYCHNSYKFVESTTPSTVKVPVNVHFNWLFAPFHRWYLYFYERILGNLIGDSTFALPFWNWDHPDGMYIPAIFNDATSPLYDKKRNAKHLPPVLIDLNWDKKDTSVDVDKNYSQVYKYIADAKDRESFFGSTFKDDKSGVGTLETLHNAGHTWTGDPTADPRGEDMGKFYSSGRDPLFYSHHSNVDRLWTIWKDKFDGVDFSDEDYLKSSFLFYDENKNFVRVSVEQCLDLSKLNYTYMDVPIPWENSKPLPTITAKARRAKRSLTSSAVKPPNLPLVLNSTTSFQVKRPFKSRSKEEKAKKEEVLVFEVEFDKSEDVKFDVLVFWKEDPTQATPKNREFARSFVNVSHAPTAKDMTVKYPIGLSNLLDDLEADDEDYVDVTLVPQYGDVPVKINKAYVTYNERPVKK